MGLPNVSSITPTVSERWSRLITCYVRLDVEGADRLLPTPAVFVDTDHDPSSRLTRAIFSFLKNFTLFQCIVLEYSIT